MLSALTANSASHHTSIQAARLFVQGNSVRREDKTLFGERFPAPPLLKGSEAEHPNAYPPPLWPVIGNKLCQMAATNTTTGGHFNTRSLRGFPLNTNVHSKQNLEGAGIQWTMYTKLIKEKRAQGFFLPTLRGTGWRSCCTSRPSVRPTVRGRCLHLTNFGGF